MTSLIFTDIEIKYEISMSNKAKKLRITVKNGNVTVTVPRGVSHEQARQFVETKRDWIKKHVQRHSTQSQAPKRKYAGGEKFPYMGRPLDLITESTLARKVEISIDGDTIKVLIPTFLEKEKWSEIVKQSLILWYKNQARVIFKEKLDYFSKIMGVEYKGFRVKDQKTRWGSCSSRKNINLNWKVILAPVKAIDYVIVHELAHLTYMNHSKEFWQLVAMYVPDYELQKLWLKQNGKFLTIE
ncbi:M48 family metallopeptidase [Desulfitibacter alkalitolerans]|uniref:M48 family metallopeptidase n=1 Tax=Desulfitibacter alkalitolerans TaxID=264641 RepID=UPI0004867252|nr:SprT family zinc-dependent metalloprotease [Desulfitibacter alkalitolerans]